MKMSHNQRSPGPIPERWLNCPRKSSGLVANKFLAFKTPLSEKYNDQIPEHCRFNPKFLFDVSRSYKWKIGLWIDLTNTNRFYDKEIIENEGCRYLKLQCRGHGGAPTEDQTQAFVNICHRFISQSPLEIIGVHCTHGFNRTGFLIISYLVEKMDCSVEAALSQFAAVRPPGIYKADYIKELFKRYDDVRDTLPAPPLPDWCMENDNEDGDDDGIDNEDSAIGGEDRTSSGGSRRKEFKKKNPTFMAGVPRVTVVTDTKKMVTAQRRTQDMCGWESSGFPGCQPVSMDNQNITLLHEKPYRVSWKADGTRYMMLILRENEIYFLDRDNCVFQVDGLQFPHRKDPRRHLQDTLLDGEMVIDKVNGEDIPRYLAYDIIRFDGQDVSKSHFDVRLTCIDREIVQPRRIAMAEKRINRNSEPFSIRLKQFWDVTQAGNLLSEKFAKSLSHEPDGLIFQPAREPYCAGQCKEVLKWKPMSLNSVDFKLKIVTEGGEGILPRKVGQLYVGGLDCPFSVMKFTKTLKDLDNKIIECRFENGAWIFMRERTDKSFPNSFNTASAVCHSIQDPVTTEILLNFIDHQRFGLDDRQLLPPPSKAPRR